MDDLFEAQVRAEAQKMFEVMKGKELARIVSDPDLVIEAYQKKLEETRKKLIETSARLTVVSNNYSTLVDLKTNHEMKDAAKLIKFSRSDGKQVGRNQLFDFLVDMGILCQDKSPLQTYVNKGNKWFDVILERYYSGGKSHVYQKTVVTTYGLEKIRDLLVSDFEKWWEK